MLVAVCVAVGVFDGFVVGVRLGTGGLVDVALGSAVGVFVGSEVDVDV